jgi:hypothetical protein
LQKLGEILYGNARQGHKGIESANAKLGLPGGCCIGTFGTHLIVLALQRKGRVLSVYS